MKSHMIYYSKIYENFDLNDIHMEVKKKKDSNMNSSLISQDDNSSLCSELQKDEEGLKQDALMIEYCPKIFRELRTLDDISNIELAQ